MAEEEDELPDAPLSDEEREYRDALNSGSWPQERKFVLSELHRLDVSILHLRKSSHAVRNELNRHNLTAIDRMQQLEIKLMKVTVWQTVILAIAAFIAKWLFHV